MKALPLILGLVAAGVVGALAAGVVLKDDGGSTTQVAGAPKDDGRILELQNRLDEALRRIEILESAPPVANAAPAAAAPAEVMDATVGEEAPIAAAAAAKKLEEVAKKAVAAAREKEMEEMGKRMTERFAQRENDMLDTFAEDNGLTTYQREEMGKIMAKRREAAGKYFRTMFRPNPDEKVDMKQLQADWDEAQKTATDELKSLLSTDQYEAYDKMQSDRRGRGFMGGMGGRRGR